LSTLRVNPNYILLSFHGISLFTNVTIMDVLNLVSPQFDEDVRLFHHVLASSLFCFNGQFYEQIDKFAMSLPLSPLISNLFMEDYKEEAISMSLCLFRHVDDTFVV